ncbi:hypothetical protein TorRG33x02_090540 [Trema orientale]|uniref:Uncharacterized protein n=1 Tax=Trema orientale TaxID=63057 RepID=A0A2P5FBJ8_TREOI|nr:hypothetical protein TorRG33x02_090540 [Trema orientale]
MSAAFQWNGIQGRHRVGRDDVEALDRSTNQTITWNQTTPPPSCHHVYALIVQVQASPLCGRGVEGQF